MQRRSLMSVPLSLVLLLSCCLATEANRVYIHPFYLFAADNVSCETLQTEASQPLRTLALAPLDAAVLTPDARDPTVRDAPPQNVTQRTAVLAELLNTLGVRLYQALSTKRGPANTLMSPVNTYGSLVTFYLGASVKTASSYQVGYRCWTWDKSACFFFATMGAGVPWAVCVMALRRKFLIII
jgi:angiotensinogen